MFLNKEVRKVLERIDCHDAIGDDPAFAAAKVGIALHNINAKYPNKVVEIEYHKSDCQCGPGDLCYCSGNELTFVVFDVDIVEPTPHVDTGPR